jgi:hypothetical protein
MTFNAVASQPKIGKQLLLGFQAIGVYEYPSGATHHAHFCLKRMKSRTLLFENERSIPAFSEFEVAVALLYLGLRG